MTEEKKPQHKEVVQAFTPEQTALIRQIVKEELTAFEKKQQHERRFGTPYPPNAETK